MEQFPVTKKGFDKLNAEFTDLKKVQRPAVIEAIAVAREHGDLKENAEYHAAREQQSFIEGRIQDIDGKLSAAQIIDITTIPVSNRVIFGSTVKLINLTDSQEHMYKIVGEDEADISNNKLSINSPIARQLIGKEQSELVIIEVPAGHIEYEILGIEYI